MGLVKLIIILFVGFILGFILGVYYLERGTR